MESMEKVFEKINKLFALAKRAGTEAEAQNAALRARELLLKYNLSESDVPNPEQSKKTVARNTLEAYSQKWMTLLASGIASYFRCKILKNWNKRLVIVGIKEDVEIFTPILAYTFESFLRCFKKRLAEDEEYQSLSKSGKCRAYSLLLDTYSIGYLSALRQKLEEQNRVLSECRDLVLTTPTEVNDYLNSCNVKTGKIRVRNASSTDYESKGYIDGMTSAGQFNKNIDYKVAA